MTRPEFPPSRSLPSLTLSALSENIPCRSACPAQTDIPGYIRAIWEDNPEKAYRINVEHNLFPACLGRICSRPCEDACRHGEDSLGEAVNICHLKRRSADVRDENLPAFEPLFGPSGKTVAIVGAGPAGLAAAYDLARLGHHVELYEGREKPGGMLTYAIPEFRLPADIRQRELEQIQTENIRVHVGKKLGQHLSLDTLHKEHDAVLLALGCQRSRRLDIEGQNLDGVHQGLEFMMEANAGRIEQVGSRVVVIGGGFTAIDCARMARRLGGVDVRLILRRTREDMSIRVEDLEQTLEEGVHLMELSIPVEIHGETSIKRLSLARTSIQIDKTTGSRTAKRTDDPPFEIETDTVIFAIGQEIDTNQLPDLPDFDKETGTCEWPNLFAAGDFASGSRTVIDAIGQGRAVARRIDEALMGKKRIQDTVALHPCADTPRKKEWDELPPLPFPKLDPAKRLISPTIEAETGYDDDQSRQEASRCYLCNLFYFIREEDCIYCNKCLDICPRNCIDLTRNGEIVTESLFSRLSDYLPFSKSEKGIRIDGSRCIRCGLCLRTCPTTCIEVGELALQTTCMME